MDLQISGDVATVVGAASGIGRAIAAAFAAEGCRVALVDLSPSVEQAAEAIRRESGGETASYVADATDCAALRRVADDVAARFAPTSHLVFAVGKGSGKFGFPFWNLEPGDWARVLDVNLIGAVNAAHAFAPAMIERRSGTMQFIVSVAGQIGSQTDPPYSAAKAGLINFMQCAARDLAEYGVRANALSPGMVKTALNRGVWQAWNARQPAEAKQTYDEWAEAKIRRVSPLGRWQEPEDIAAAAVFLASPAAKNITGQTLNVDGGQVMHS
jgi:NAD(P)-dependent dehydrogenase (short-subunit alcohol dehydrogenase family)